MSLKYLKYLVKVRVISSCLINRDKKCLSTKAQRVNVLHKLMGYKVLLFFIVFFLVKLVELKISFPVKTRDSKNQVK